MERGLAWTRVGAGPAVPSMWMSHYGTPAGSSMLGRPAQPKQPRETVPPSSLQRGLMWPSLSQFRSLDVWALAPQMTHPVELFAPVPRSSACTSLSSLLGPSSSAERCEAQRANGLRLSTCLAPGLSPGIFSTQRSRHKDRLQIPIRRICAYSGITETGLAIWG